MDTFEEIGRKIGQLVSEKNIKYGDSFSKSDGILKILYPEGIALRDYKNVLTIVRIVDKLFRIATDDENETESPFEDIAGYCILSVAKNSAKKSAAADEK
jgi:hypothetical protein